MEKDLLKIEIIKEYFNKKQIYYTKHFLNRIHKRNISIEDIKLAIKAGKIIEYYYNDFPYPSCLILGYTLNNIAIHIVCGIKDNMLYMITAYYPDEEKWINDMEKWRN